MIIDSMYTLETLIITANGKGSIHDRLNIEYCSNEVTLYRFNTNRPLSLADSIAFHSYGYRGSQMSANCGHNGPVPKTARVLQKCSLTFNVNGREYNLCRADYLHTSVWGRIKCSPSDLTSPPHPSSFTWPFV